MSPAEIYAVVGEHVFPFLRTLGGDDSTYAHHMKDARFTIPTPALLSKVVDMLDSVPMEDRDTKGDLYEYMLGKIASAGQNGQFRTPRHIIRLMVEMTAPQPSDLICDPAFGTAGFLVAAGEYVREHHPKVLHDEKLREHFHHRMFHGFDFDNTMLRIGSMNMLLHGVENPDIRYRDSLAQDHAGDEEAYTLVLANPPFAGSLDYENTAKDLLQIVKTKKTELLFLALFLRLLKPGGRAAVIVPDGVLFGSSKAHKELRRMLVEEHRPMIDLIDPQRPISYGILMPGPDQASGVKYVRVVDMKNGGIEISGIRKTTEAISNSFRRSLLKPGDLLMSIRGHVGRFAVVPHELDGANITQDTARLAVVGASSVFVRECLRTIGFQRWMAKHTKGVAVRGINLGDVKLMPIILPPRRIQDEFARKASSIEKLQTSFNASLTEMNALFASLQHCAFRGEL